MNTYDVRVPIVYNTQSILNDYNESSYINYELDEPITQTIRKTLKTDSSTEECTVEVILRYEEASSQKIGRLKGRLIIDINGFKADAEELAYAFAENVAANICKKLSLCAMLSNMNIHHFRTKFTYDAQMISVKLRTCPNPIKRTESEDGVVNITLRDNLVIRSSIELTSIKGLNHKDFYEVNEQTTKNDLLNFLCEAYYQASGNNTHKNIYFNLFLILEYIEENYDSDSKSTKIFDEEDIDEIIKKIHEYLVEIMPKKESIDARYTTKKIKEEESSIKSSVAKRTYESRAEKLFNIIQNRWKINEVSLGMVKYELTKEKVKEFIKTRNDIVHANKNQTAESIEKQEKLLFKLNNELLALCACIYKAEVLVK